MTILYYDRANNNHSTNYDWSNTVILVSTFPFHRSLFSNNWQVILMSQSITLITIVHSILPEAQLVKSQQKISQNRKS